MARSPHCTATAARWLFGAIEPDLSRATLEAAVAAGRAASVNSIFTLGLVIGLSVQDTTFGTTVANLGMTDTVFPKPVFSGDTIRSQTIVKALRPSRSRPGQGIVTFEHIGLNQNNETVCRTLRSALMLGHPA